MAHSAQGHRRGGPQGFCVHTITGPTEQRSEPSRVELSCRDSPTSGLAQRRGHRAPERKGLLVDSVRGSWTLSGCLVQSKVCAAPRPPGRISFLMP